MRYLAILVGLTLLMASGSQAAERRLSGGAKEIPANGTTIVLETGKGALIRLPRPASTVFVANPDIADVQVKTPMLVYLTAKTPGETVIYAVDAKNAVLLKSPVLVEPDLSRLRQTFASLMPGQQINVRSVEGNVVLSGMVTDAGTAEKVRALAISILGAGKGRVINQLKVATPNQVNLRVRIDEVDRSVLKDLGINWQKLGNTGLMLNTNNPVSLSGEATNNIIFGKIGGKALSAELSALTQEGYITVLAEPNLTTMNGQTASFLAGGEFPVPISGSTSNGVPTITVDFKKFGVSLAFTPTIVDAMHLNLKIAPEVSQLTNNGAVSVPIGANQVVTIPALTVRSAQTTVELGSGETFALAGLLQRNIIQEVSEVPALGDIPILGALFRSNRFQNNESELIILVTPYLVQPTETPLAGPTDGYSPAHDLQQVLTGATYKQELPAPARGPLGAGGQGLIGPAGFQLH